MITPYEVGTKGRIQMGNGADATYYPAVVTEVEDYTEWCDTLRDEEPMYTMEVTFPKETVEGLINHCRFTPEDGWTDGKNTEA